MSPLLRTRLLILFVLGGVTIIIWLIPFVSYPTTCKCLTVNFLDVGQGDSILIETPDNVEMLIDGGRDSSVLRALSKEMSIFDREIDVVVATHPDSDHIGGLVDVIKRYKVPAILLTENEHDTPTASAFATAVDDESAELIYADAGQQFLLGKDVVVTVFSPVGDERLWESNTASVVLKVTYGDTSFMLTGDAPSEIENHLVDTYGEKLKSDVLKLGHHGSRTSTSEGFLDAVSPSYAVVSAGVGNSYGHPHQEVMQRVFARNIQSSHTGTDGTVTFVSDGETVWRE
jgi:competence protein ComEC